MNYTNKLLSKVKQAISTYSLLNGKKNIVVALSGGSDSVTLLHLMLKLKADAFFSDRGGMNIIAVHVNHGIRGSEADRDANFCLNFCQKYSIECFVEKIDIPALCAERKTGLEQTAREERYRILQSYAEKLSDSVILTAHNADDNLETLIFNLSRGSASKGLCGIPPIRDNIERPLILCTKQEIEGYCAENGLDCVYDSTNSDTEYRRNFIRHKIMPLLRELNPSIAVNVADTCRKLSFDCLYLENKAAEYADCDKIEILKTLPYPILSRVIIQKYRNISDLTLCGINIDSVINLIYGENPCFSVTLPGNTSAVSRYGILSFEKCYNIPSVEKYNIKLNVGENILPSGILFISDGIVMPNCEFINNSVTTICIKADSICGKMFARTREDGDRLFYHEKNKTLKNLFNELHIAPKDRAVLPIICDDNGIICIPSCALRDGCGIKKNDFSDKITIYFRRTI